MMLMFLIPESMYLLFMKSAKVSLIFRYYINRHVGKIILPKFTLQMLAFIERLRLQKAI